MLLHDDWLVVDALYCLVQVDRPSTAFSASSTVVECYLVVQEYVVCMCGCVCTTFSLCKRVCGLIIPFHG